MDAKLVRIKELIEEKERIDSELEGLINGTKTVRAPQKCGVCGQEGHSARKCPTSETAGQ